MRSPPVARCDVRRPGTRSCLAAAAALLAVTCGALVFGLRNGPHPPAKRPPPAAAGPATAAAVLFRAVVGPCNASSPAQHFTTDEHVQPRYSHRR